MATPNRRTVQGEVTLNLMPNQREAQQRLNMASSGSEVAAYPLGSKENLHIHEGDFLFGFKQPPYSTPKMRGTRLPSTFATLNGMPWGHYQGGERELEDSVYFQGISKLNKHLLDPSEHETGVSAIAHGGATANIRSNTKAIHPGDDVAFSMPRFHSRRGEVTQAPHNAYARDALVPEINPVDWRRTEYWLENLYGVLFSDDSVAGAYQHSIGRLDDLQVKGLNKDQQAALALKKNVLFTVLRAIEELQLRGVVKIVTPEEDLVMQDDAVQAAMVTARINLTSAEKTNVLTGTGLQYVQKNTDPNMPSAIGPQLTQKHVFFKHGLHGATRGLSAEQMQEERAKQQRDLLFLAQALGAVGNSASQRLSDDVLQSVFSKYSTQMHSARIFSTTVGELVREDAHNPLVRQYVQRSEDFTAELIQLVAAAYHSVMSTIIGMSLSHVPPGARNGVIDMLVGGRNAAKV